MKHLFYAMGLLCLVFVMSSCENSQSINDNTIEIPEGVIYFTKVNGSNAALERVSMDGSNHKLFKASGLITQYPINNKIVYNVADRNSDSRKLCTSNYDGSNEKVLSSFTDEAIQYISPDGRYLITVYEKDSIVSHDKITGTDVKISSNHVSTMLIDMSPDGKKIAFIENTGVPTSGVLYVANVDGTDKKGLADGMYYKNDMPMESSWSMDSKYIIAVNSPRTTIFILSVDGTEIYSINSSVGEMLTPVFSPDNMTVAYSDGLKIITNNFQGTNRKVIVDGTNDIGYRSTAPFFSPDGKNIGYMRKDTGNKGDWEIRYYNIASGENKQILKVTFDEAIVDPYLMSKVYWF